MKRALERENRCRPGTGNGANPLKRLKASRLFQVPEGPVATVRAHKAITPKCSSRSCFAFAGACDWCQVAITFFQVLEPCVQLL